MTFNRTIGSTQRRRNAFTLIEMLVYMGLLVVVVGLAYAAMYRSMDSSTALRRNATDVSRALEAGERWRADVRSANGSPRVETAAGRQEILHLPQPRGEIAYRFTSNSVLRRVGTGPWQTALRDVKHSSMLADRRENLTAWRWELELQTSRKKITQVRPLFTFVAVPRPNVSR